MIAIFEPLLLQVSFVGSLIAQSVYFIIDDRTENHTPKDLKLKKYWHWAGGAIHIWGGYVMSRFFGWQYGLLTASTTWYFLDGCINSFVLGKEWWFIGTTAWLDKLQHEVADLMHIDARTTSAILKNLLLIFSIASFFIWK